MINITFSAENARELHRKIKDFSDYQRTPMEEFYPASAAKELSENSFDAPSIVSEKQKRTRRTKVETANEASRPVHPFMEITEDFIDLAEKNPFEEQKEPEIKIEQEPKITFEHLQAGFKKLSEARGVPAVFEVLANLGLTGENARIKSIPESKFAQAYSELKTALAA